MSSGICECSRACVFMCMQACLCMCFAKTSVHPVIRNVSNDFIPTVENGNLERKMTKALKNILPNENFVCNFIFM